MTKPAYRGEWRKVRRFILERDRYECQIRARGCTGVAEHVDHIVPVVLGGAILDEENLRASCRNCNLTRKLKRTQTSSIKSF